MSEKRLVAVVQARMGSTRLPGKVLLPICDEPVLWHIVQRLNRVPGITSVIVATSERPENDLIREFCEQRNILCFSGSENDVLARFYLAAKSQNADVVIRVTADCPLVDPALIGKVLDSYYKNGFDYCSVAAGAGVANEGFHGRFPDGLDAEVFSFKILSEAFTEAVHPLHREHVTPFLWSQPNRFKLGNIKSEIDYSAWRLTLDHHGDLDLIRTIYKTLYPKKPFFDLKDVVSLIESNPEYLKINSNYIGNEGYQEFWNGNIK